MHERRIVHRDIKPGNLLLSRDGDIVVFDLVDLEPGERKRYLDFVAGLAFALRGRIEADGTRFTLLPEGVELSDTDRDRLSV